MKDLCEGNRSKWSASPEAACQHRKTPRKMAVVVKINGLGGIIGDDCNSVIVECGSRSIVCPVAKEWPESLRRRADVMMASQCHDGARVENPPNMWGKSQNIGESNARADVDNLNAL